MKQDKKIKSTAKERGIEEWECSKLNFQDKMR